MSVRLCNVVINARDTRVLADFWCAALGWSVVDEEDGVLSLADPEQTWPVLDLVPGAGEKTGHNRVHLDLRADGGSTQSAEVERLLALGARRADVGQGDDVSWVVLADPEGNEFCVLSRTADEAAADG
ncbi:VOC family protein [uncultured Nocardioides sp.]|uniref:VOC family protein n=1 Tax=uncultured Nocardioides sp. TaxID=198441 RepID=UPI00262F0615|nr:VOC family protein [uncultured Nocardioides sp.]